MVITPALYDSTMRAEDLPGALCFAHIQKDVDLIEYEVLH